MRRLRQKGLFPPSLRSPGRCRSRLFSFLSGEAYFLAYLGDMRRSISSYNIIKKKYERIGLWKRRGKSSCARSAQKSRIRERFTATSRSSSPRNFIWGRPCCPRWKGVSITGISPSICSWILPRVWVSRYPSSCLSRRRSRPCGTATASGILW